MKIRQGLKNRIRPLLAALITVSIPSPCVAQDNGNTPILLHAARVFDGNEFKTGTSVLLKNGQIAQIGARESFAAVEANTIDLGDATLLPGFIELHAHLHFRGIPADTVLRHGVTTLRDVGGPPHPPAGGDGSLRVLTAGLILTAPAGYPIPGMGAENIAVPVANADEARAAVRRMIEGGAAVIKVALEPGGEHGAPWSGGHGHDHAQAGHTGHASEQGAVGAGIGEPVHHHKHWPMLPENVVQAIVNEAHRLDRRVTAHLAEVQGVKLALKAGVDEWAHMPCEPIPHTLLKQAVAQGVVIVGTLDTLSHCAGIAENTRNWTALGGELLYGAEIAHPDIPWGIDAQELDSMVHLAGLQPAEVLRAATAGAGKHLNIPLLGTLQPGAPADLIAVKGDLSASFKNLEYPDLVISGGKLVVNNFGNDTAPNPAVAAANAAR